MDNSGQRNKSGTERQVSHVFTHIWNQEPSQDKKYAKRDGATAKALTHSLVPIIIISIF